MWRSEGGQFFSVSARKRIAGGDRANSETHSLAEKNGKEWTAKMQENHTHSNSFPYSGGCIGMGIKRGVKIQGVYPPARNRQGETMGGESHAHAL